MKEKSARLAPRERQVVELLLRGYDNADIARELNIALQTVKSHFNRLFLRFGITGGIKRVKLATYFYRRNECQQVGSMEIASPTNANDESLNLSPED